MLNIAVRPLYEQRGRVRLAILGIRTEPAGDVEGVHVFVKLDEGQSYALGKVAIDGPSPIDPATLLKTGDFKTGDVANFDRVNDGMDKIRKALRRAGYLEAKLTSERAIDDAKKTVDVALRIDPGAQYTTGKLTVVGLDLNGEAEIETDLDDEGRQDVQPRVSRLLPAAHQRAGALRRPRRHEGGDEDRREDSRCGRHPDIQGGRPR